MIVYLVICYHCPSQGECVAEKSYDSYLGGQIGLNVKSEIVS